MLDINIPPYVWIIFSIVFVIREIRYWFDMVLEYDIHEREFNHECERDDKDHEVSESVKRMFS